MSELCLGTQAFGWRIDEPRAFALLDAFHAAGGNFIQATALCPDFPFLAESGGLPESLVGRWRQDRKVAREQLRLATRLSVRRARSGVRTTPALIREACEASLRRLQVDHLDLLLLEWTDALLPIDEAFEVIASLVRAGYLRYGGVSGFPNWRVADLIGHAKRLAIARPEAMQVDFSLLNRGVSEVEAREVAREYRLALLARAPLARGLLADVPEPVGYAAANATERVLAGVRQVAREHDVPAAQVAFAWVLSSPEVTSMVIGPRTVSHLNDALAATQLRLTPDQIALLDDLSLQPAPRLQTDAPATPIRRPRLLPASSPFTLQSIES